MGSLKRSHYHSDYRFQAEWRRMNVVFDVVNTLIEATKNEILEVGSLPSLPLFHLRALARSAPSDDALDPAIKNSTLPGTQSLRKRSRHTTRPSSRRT